MTKCIEELLAKTKELFGESTDPETIKKFKAVEEAATAADQEMTALTEKYGQLARDYRDAILGTGTKTPPEAVTPPTPKTFGDALAEAVKSAQPKQA